MVVSEPAELLNMAEIQFSIVTRQKLDQPFQNSQQVETVVTDWASNQNQLKAGANWQFKTKDARVKLRKLYPTI